MENKKRLTILLGAGAVVEATGVSTKSITKKVIQECKGYKMAPDKGQSVVDYICKEYWELFGKSDPAYKSYSKASLDAVVNYVNFEDIFHVVELLSGYTLDSTTKKYTSAYKVFTKFKTRFKDVDRNSITASARKIIEVINDIVADYSRQFENKSGYFKKFIQSLGKEYTLNIFTLNYDTWCEQSISFDDGFRDISGYTNLKRFSIEEYRSSCDDSTNTIAHLHGSILLGDAELKRNEINRFAYEEARDSLYKYKDYASASNYRKRLYKSSSSNQAGEAILSSNVITGLMKTDKLLCNPLMEYEHHFYRALTSNDRLLIVGYSFGDKYINSMLWRFQSKNYNKRKVMLITKVSKETEWIPQIEAPLDPPEMTVFTELMFKNQGWFCGVGFKQVQKGYYAEDNMAGIYTCGLKAVAEKYMKDVVRFYR